MTFDTVPLCWTSRPLFLSVVSLPHSVITHAVFGLFILLLLLFIQSHNLFCSPLQSLNSGISFFLSKIDNVSSFVLHLCFDLRAKLSILKMLALALNY